ncbi:hypothetical protein LQ384_28425 [Rhodococcus rhodochrous]|uniref:ESX secretion-associated protein EspG n=1 Tax=Rhodococcus rhodochrous TaxID=1829 RepID=A0AAW4XQM7_RHORH|nr:hypothetical protein [Rhodococcus rhodochrous]MCD2115005.1 hypothetical protein [Rhodococcus rhodochrous]
MTEPGNEDPRVVAVMRLSGVRFESEGMPADALVEVAAFEDILRSLVRLYWLDRHPHRQRVPAGYDREITLRLTKIGEGSAVPVLEYDPALHTDDLFGLDEIAQDYSRAVKVLEEFIQYGNTGQDPIPNDIRRLPSPKVKKFGQTMRKGEAIQVAVASPDDWEKIPAYTPQARSNALVSLVGNVTRPVTIEGKVTDFNVSTGNLVVQDRERKRTIYIPYLDSGLTVNIVAVANQLFECEAKGIGEFSADGRLTKLVSVETLNVIDVTEDARVVRSSLDALAELEEGWVDGEFGEPITESVIERGHEVIEAMIALSNITRVVAPTEEGGVRFFWPEAENQLSIEVEPSGALYVHTTDLAAGTFTDDKISADVDDLVEALGSWLSEGVTDE